MKRLTIAILLCTFLIKVVSAAEVTSDKANGAHQMLQKNTSNTPDFALISLEKIKSLRQAGRLNDAEIAAKQYLEKYPNDVDAMLLLGLIYIQKENDSEGELYLNKVLLKSPNYMDARVALVQLKIKNKQFEEAKSLIRAGLGQDPQQNELLDLQKKIEASTNQPVIIKKVDQQPKTYQEPTAYSEPKVTQEKKANKDSTQVLAEIKELKRQNKLNLAKEKAINFLKENPNDPDVSYMLGVIYYNQGEYSHSDNQLKKVLDDTPHYVDARVILIKIKLAQKNYKAARQLRKEGLVINPKNKQLLALKLENGSSSIKSIDPVKLELQQAGTFVYQKQFSKAQAMYQNFVRMNPCNVDFQIALTEFYLLRHNDQAALATLRRALRCCPNNVKLLVKKGEVHMILHQYDLAAKSYATALVLDPKNKNASSLLNEVAEISPRHLYGLNEIGAWTDNAYVTDLHSIWNWSNIYYARDMDWGRAIFNIGYASRLGIDGEQYTLNLLPRFNRNIYFDLIASYSDRAALFPTSLAGAEGYWNIPGFFELSAGARHSKIDRTYFDTYTGSFNFYPGKWWLSFRPYYFVPKDRTKDSILYTASARRYFATDDHYIGIGGGSGRSPDLADLLTVNFIVIKNSFVNANYSFPLCNHHLVVDLGVGYQRWVYPSSLVRRLYDASIGFKYRFEG